VQNSEREKRVLIVGDANTDLIVQYPRRLPNGEILYPTPMMTGGGTAANTALALSKLGVNVEFMGTVGDDQNGRYVIDELNSAGVGTGPVIIDRELNTVCVFAFIDEGGERYLWAWPRERQSFNELDPAKISWEAVENADWVHSSGMIAACDSSARRSVIDIFRRCREMGITTSFDLNLRVENNALDISFRDAVLEILEYCNYVFGSGKEELYYLAPKPDWRESARELASECRTIIARMGHDGSAAVTPFQWEEERPFPVEVRDTVGAGDVYNAGFIAARLKGKSLRDSIIWGNGVASFKVARNGSRSAPDLKELSDFLAGFGESINDSIIQEEA